VQWEGRPHDVVSKPSIVGPDFAEFLSCRQNGTRVYRVSDGSTIDDSIATEVYKISLVKQNDAWKVIDSHVTDSKNGVVPCDTLDY
jgi:hypothetical protein